MLSRRKFLKLGLAAGAAALLGGKIKPNQPAFAEAPAAVRARVAAQAVAQTPLPGKMIPQFVDPLPSIDLRIDDGENSIKLYAREFQAQVMPSTFVPASGPYAGTWTWGYLEEGMTSRSTYLGPIIVATRNQPTTLSVHNELGTTSATNVLAYKYSTDQTLHWADPLNNNDGMIDMGNMCMHMPSPTPMGECAANYNGPIPIAVHLHGGEVPPELDGGPDNWYTNAWTDAQGNPHEPLHGKGYYTGGAADTNEVIYRYPNAQEGGLIWYHDHTLGATRLNVYAGLAGGYVLVDPNEPYTDPRNWGMPFYPLVIQDRMFDTNGQLYYPAGLPFIPNPDHPYWVPEFIGDTICVNGKVWPYLAVEPKRYAFYLINGSNARTYEMFLTNPVTKAMGPAIWQVGTDGGLLDAPVKIDPNAVVLPRLVLMPGERAIIIIDFAGLPAGTTLLLRNVAKAPYPGGLTPDGNTTGRIMQFRVGQSTGPDTSYNPAAPATPLRKSLLVRLANPATGALAAGVSVTVTRRLTLNEIMGMPTTLNGVAYPGGPLEIVVNNTKWSGVYQTGMMNNGMMMGDFQPDVNLPLVDGALLQDKFGNYISEYPDEGATEIWEIVNLTADAHPMHTHLTQFQLLSRQNFDVKKYLAVYGAAFPGGGYDMMTGLPYPAKVFIPSFGPPMPYSTLVSGAVGGNPDVTPFLRGAIRLPNANEAGWKDTILTPPGMVTRFVVRFAPIEKAVTDPQMYYPFDPGPESKYAYVWHCHIVDHEDNEMMRPHLIHSNKSAERTYRQGTDF